MVATRARWQVGASRDRSRSKECFEDSSSGEFEGSDENVGVKGKSNESDAKVSGLSARVECVGAGDSGKVKLGDDVECRGDDESSAGEGEGGDLDEEGDDGVSGG